MKNISYIFLVGEEKKFLKKFGPYLIERFNLFYISKEYPGIFYFMYNADK
jgi:hypothetical protein